LVKEALMQGDIAVVESLSVDNPTFYGHPNPVNRKDVVKLYDESLSLGDPLDKEELAIFKQQFVELLAPPGSEERRLMLNRVEQYMLALRAIKNAVGAPKFRGLNPSTTELGFGLIRPVHTISTALSPRIQWIWPWTVAYADWICAVGGGAGYGIGAKFGLCITHLKSFTTPTPVLAEIQVTVGRSQLLPIDVRNLRIGDTVNQVSIVPIPTIIAIPTNTLYIRGRSDTVAATNDEVALGGLVFGLGRVLVQTITYPLL
jgi:hypothetical protein